VKCNNKSDKVVPVITAATVTISESFRKYLSNIPGKHKIKELQKRHNRNYMHISESTNVKVQNIQNGK
jgi:hypothetical protein